MQLYFIRHAESENNASYARSGTSAHRVADPVLTEKGWKQAEKLAEYISRRPLGDSTAVKMQDRNGIQLDHLYCSLMLRSVQTCYLMAESAGITPVAWPEWHERGGLYIDDADSGEPLGQAGPDRAFWQSKFPRLTVPVEVADGGWWQRPYETIEEAQTRACTVVTELVRRHGNGNDSVGVVSHGGFYQAIVSELLGLNEVQRAATRYAINNAAISRFDIHEEITTVLYMNATDHLPDELLTL